MELLTLVLELEPQELHKIIGSALAETQEELELELKKLFLQSGLLIEK